MAVRTAHYHLKHARRLLIRSRIPVRVQPKCYNQYHPIQLLFWHLHERSAYRNVHQVFRDQRR